jgi:hypothetical protein
VAGSEMVVIVALVVVVYMAISIVPTCCSSACSTNACVKAAHKGGSTQVPSAYAKVSFITAIKRNHYTKSRDFWGAYETPLEGEAPSLKIFAPSGKALYI